MFLGKIVSFFLWSLHTYIVYGCWCCTWALHNITHRKGYLRSTTGGWT